jgi:hypothetical protein
MAAQSMPWDVVVRTPGQAAKSHGFETEREARNYYHRARKGLSRYGSVELWKREASGGVPIAWYPKRGKSE